VKLDVLGPLGELIGKVLQGKGGLVANAAVQVVDVRPEFFSPGRQLLMQKMLKDLQAGWIEPFTPALQ
jgi:hypothetical protein